MVTVTREPAFADDEAPAPVTADPLTGRFRLLAPLAVGEAQTLSVFAEDAAENVSEPALVAITQDASPPPPPFLEPIPSTTTATTIDLEGTSKPGVTIAVSREPALASEAPMATADPLSGRFRLTVPLATEATNTLSVTATGALGGPSDAATVSVQQLPIRASRLLISLSTTELSADDGEIAVLIEGGHDEPDADLSGVAIEISVEDYAGAVASQTATLGPSRVAEVRVTGLTTAGSGRIVARAVLPTPDGDTAVDSRSFLVRAGRPASASLQLSDGTATGNPLTTAAGASVQATVEVEDAFGNAIAAPALALSTTAPGVLVAGTSLLGFNTAGVWDVHASVDDGLLVTTGLVSVDAGPAVGIALELSESALAAGDDLFITATAVDAFGNSAAAPPMLAEDVPIFHPGLPDEDPQAVLDLAAVGGVVTARLVPLTAGSFVVTATLDAGLSADAAFQVAAGPPASFDLNLDQVGPFTAGDVIPFTTTTLDAFGNISDAEVIVTVDAPSATTAVDAAGSGEILGLVNAGSYTLTARLPGGVFADTETVVIDPAPGQGFNLLLSSVLTVEGSRVLVILSDAFGNAIDIADVAITIDGTDVAVHPSVSLNGQELTFAVPGTFSVTAGLIGDPTIADTELVSVQGVVDTLAPTAVVTLTYPAGDLIPLNSFFEVTTSFSDTRALAEGEVIAQFGDGAGCATSSGRLILGGLTTYEATSTLQVPGCALPGDAVTLSARVLDQAGNLAYSPPLSGVSIALLPGFDITATTGFAATVGAFGDRIDQADAPRDLVANPAAGVFYVTLNQNDRVVVTFPDRDQQDLRDAFDNRVDVAEINGIARASTGELFFGSIADVEIDLFDAFQAHNQGWISPAVAPGRLSYDETGPAPMLCAALPVSNAVRCYRNAMTAPSIAGTLTGLSLPTSASLRDGRLWVAEAGCAVKYSDVTYDLSDPANPGLTFGPTQTVADLGNDCPDIAALPSGAAAVIHRGGQEVVHVQVDGTQTLIAENLSDPQGLDAGDAALYLLDASLEAVFVITGAL